MKRKPTGEPLWRYRRSVAIGVLVYSLYMIWSMQGAEDTLVNRSIIDSAFMLAMAFGLGYTGLATAQDIAAIWRTKSALPYREQEQTQDQPVEETQP